MVNEFEFSRSTVYLCEVCGYGYRNLETAEHCEQHCAIEMQGSATIRQRAIYQPKVEIVPIAPGRTNHRLKIHL